MYQQNSQSQAQTHAHLLAEEDLAYTVLADLKRTAKEYATAVTEANCQVIRETFTTLLNNTLRLQGQLYTIMSQNNMYDKPTTALRQDVDKQLQKQKQTQQKIDQLLQKASLTAMSSASAQQQYQTFQQNQIPVAAGAFQSHQAHHNQYQPNQLQFQANQNQFQHQQHQFQQQQNQFKQNALHASQQQHVQQNQSRMSQNNGFLPLQPIHQSPSSGQQNYFS